MLLTIAFACVLLVLFLQARQLDRIEAELAELYDDEGE